MDFTLDLYKRLLFSLKNAGKIFYTFSDYLNDILSKAGIILRHDVDKLPGNSLTFAKIQYEMGIKGSYYFRTIPKSFDKKIINEIAELGHEIGYHYENLDTTKGDMETGIRDFERNLEKFRKIYPVKTICMHGSPLSKYDNRDLWTKYDYHDYGIIGEPYFDIDFNNVFYLTDTGRIWDGFDVSVRDKVLSQKNAINNLNYKKEKQKFRTTYDIITAIINDNFPNQAMLTFHPQRWTNNYLLWLKELIGQKSKNMIKKYWFVKKNGNYIF